LKKYLEDIRPILSCIFRIFFLEYFILYLEDTYFGVSYLVSSRYFFKVSCTSLSRAMLTPCKKEQTDRQMDRHTNRHREKLSE